MMIVRAVAGRRMMRTMNYRRRVASRVVTTTMAIGRSFGASPAAMKKKTTTDRPLSGGEIWTMTTIGRVPGAAKRKPRCNRSVRLA
jgi:hypothetical protein